MSVTDHSYHLPPLHVILVTGLFLFLLCQMCENSSNCVRIAHTRKQDDNLNPSRGPAGLGVPRESSPPPHSLAKCATWGCLSACSSAVETKACATRSESACASLQLCSHEGRPAVCRLPLTQFKVAPAAPSSAVSSADRSTCPCLVAKL